MGQEDLRFETWELTSQAESDENVVGEFGFEKKLWRYDARPTGYFLEDFEIE